MGTPIGNLEDITFRAVRILKEADLIACEDTRQTRKLLDHYGIAKPTVSYHEHNEAERSRELTAKLRDGITVALVSDAGMPLISDPGYRLVRAAIESGIRVEAVPGASAAAHRAGGVRPAHRQLPFRRLPAGQIRPAAARARSAEGRDRHADLLRSSPSHSGDARGCARGAGRPARGGGARAN